MPLTRRAFGHSVGLGAIARTVQALAVPAPTTSGQVVQTAGRPLTPAADAICDQTATELAALLRRRELSALEVMRAHLARIERVNPRVNAIVTLVAERALADAARADQRMARGDVPGPLHGLPVAHKDLVDTAGIRTTMGSLHYKDQVPERDAEIVARMRRAGAITCGKTNTPEMGAGSQTFNRVFGATRNPWHTGRTCGGSSGGAAVALACGMVPLADGSDTGGSLRNPAAFCNVVGFRPSPGRVPGAATWSPLSVAGPMARTTADAALLLSVLAGAHAGTPLSLDDDPVRFRGGLDRDFKGARVAWWAGLGGLPVEPEIRDVVDGTRRVFEDLGCVVEPAEPAFDGVDEAFQTLRVTANHPRYAALMARDASLVKDTIQWEVREAARLTGADVGRALARQSRMHQETRRFFERHEYFVLPVTQVSPFDVDIPYPTRIGETPMTTYIDWMRSCWYVTFMACPAISVPAGFTKEGLPVGLQIVGRPRADWSVLQMAHAFERATGHGRRRPAILDA